jgi:hypothetical protein
VATSISVVELVVGLARADLLFDPTPAGSRGKFRTLESHPTDSGSDIGDRKKIFGLKACRDATRESFFYIPGLRGLCFCNR